MAEENKDEKKDNASSEPTKGEESKKESQEYVQIPKSEYEGWKKEIEETKNFREQTAEYIKGASVVVTTLASDPELTKAFRSKLAGDGQISGEQSKKENKENNPSGSESRKIETPPEVTELTKTQRLEITTSFEKEAGIDKMDKEDRKLARQGIESYMNKFGTSWQTAPLSTLRDQLNTAWVGSRAEKLKEEGKLEGFAQMRVNMGGANPTISGGAPAYSSDEKNLTEGQKKWAEKLGVDPDKAKKTYFDKDNEEKRVPSSEKSE